MSVSNLQNDIKIESKNNPNLIEINSILNEVDQKEL